MPSPSTLIRRARKTRDPKEAKRLRKLAAASRRALRAKAKKKTVRRKRKLPDQPATREVTSAANVGVQAEGWSVRHDGENMIATHGVQGGHINEDPPLIDGAAIEALRHMAKKRYQPYSMKDGYATDDFAISLRAKLVATKHNAAAEARKRLEDRHLDTLKTIHEVNAINVVCAFMATMQTYEKMHNGLPPTVIVSGHTLARVYDALRDAGYTPDGKGGAGGKAGDRDAMRRQIAARG